MLELLAAMMLDARISNSTECELLQAALQTEIISREIEAGAEISVWGSPDWPVSLQSDSLEWRCELPAGVRWERQSRERFGGDHRTMVIQASEPLVSGESAFLRLSYSQWEPEADAGWASDHDILLNRVDGVWQVGALRWRLIAD
tara:strand:+ start:1882 stop:2316 length:435 start_codon:yes stop_codon:yes gene_type:complete